jgi:hypothetical protein
VARHSGTLFMGTMGESIAGRYGGSAHSIVLKPRQGNSGGKARSDSPPSRLLIRQVPPRRANTQRP